MSNKNKLIMLGCGGSSGVPCPGLNPNGEWGACDPNIKENYRTRSSVYIEYKNLKILIDVSPDFRQQYLANKLHGIDAVIITHAHSDHISGIHDLRPVYYSQKRKLLPIYATQETFQAICGTYGYLFDKQEQINIYPTVLEKKIITEDFFIKDAKIEIMTQPHGDITSLGFRIENLAYSTDFNYLPNDVLDKLQNLDVWILDCLSADGRKPPSHNYLEQAIEYVRLLKPKRAILTHMGKYFDYREALSLIPQDINLEPGHDGLTLYF